MKCEGGIGVYGVFGRDQDRLLSDGYEGLGQFLVRRRPETEVDFRDRKRLGQWMNMTFVSHELFDRLKRRDVLRDGTRR